MNRKRSRTWRTYCFEMLDRAGRTTATFTAFIFGHHTNVIDSGRAKSGETGVKRDTVIIWSSFRLFLADRARRTRNGGPRTGFRRSRFKAPHGPKTLRSNLGCKMRRGACNVTRSRRFHKWLGRQSSERTAFVYFSIFKRALYDFALFV